MVNVRAAVEGMRDALSRLAANSESDQEGVLLLNVRERRDALSRSIQQLSPGTLSQQVGCVEVLVTHILEVTFHSTSSMPKVEMVMEYFLL